MMKNNFDDIIKNKLGSVSQEPPAELWSKINSSLPSSQFDSIISEKLSVSNINPPESIWPKIASEIRKPFYLKPAFWWSAASVAVLFISLSIFTNNGNEQLISSHKKVIRDSKVYSIQNKAKTNQTGNQNNKEQGFTNNQPSDKIAKHFNSTITNQNIISQSKPQEINQNGNPSTSTFAENEQSNTLKGINGITIQPEEIANSQPYHIQTNDTSISSLPKVENIALLAESDSLQVNDNIELAKNEIIRNPRNLNKIGAFAVINPLYIKQGLNEVIINSINLGGVYQNENLLAEAGFGLGFSEEKINYRMDYQRYEFVKKQFVTDSLAFYYDTTSNSVVPIGFGHHEDVYDDVYHTYSSTLSTRFTYFNIPLRFGYIWDFRRYSLSLKGSINYNLIIAKSTSGLLELDENSTLVSIYMPEKTRYINNFSYGLASGFNMKLRKDLYFTSELGVNYFQNNIYSNVEASNKPLSLNLNGGILYYF